MEPSDEQLAEAQRNQENAIEPYDREGAGDCPRDYRHQEPDAGAPFAAPVAPDDDLVSLEA
jgi:hypothetical protein